MSPVILFFLFSGSLFSIVLSIALLCARHKQYIHYLAAALLATVSFWQLQMALYAGNFYIIFPHFLLSHIPVLFLTGPLLFEFMSSLTDPQRRPASRLVLHLLPALVSAGMLIPFYLRTGSEKILMFRGGFVPGGLPYLSVIIPALLRISLVSMGIYLILVLKGSAFLIPLKNGQRTPNATMVFVLAMVLAALTALAVFGQVYNPSFKTASVLGINAVTLFLFFIRRETPASCRTSTGRSRESGTPFHGSPRWMSPLSSG